MGCRASKEATTGAVVAANHRHHPAAAAAAVASPASKASPVSKSSSTSKKSSPSSKSSSSGVIKKRESAKSRPTSVMTRKTSNARRAPSNSKLLQMLLKVRASGGNATGVWPQAIQMLERDPLSASYEDPKTKSTPLHLACSMVDYDDGADGDTSSIYSVVSGIRALIQAGPDTLAKEDSMGKIPLHYVFDPAVPPGIDTERRWGVRAAVLRLIVSADYETSSDYMSRNDIKYAGDDDLGSCTPLYYALYSIPDDFRSPGRTVEYISVVHEANPHLVSVSNMSDGDKPLALLYRRFTRQFDLSEKFFAGDNSRSEVVDHRRKYKIAAGNTWKIIELLLRPESGSNFRIVHRAIQVDCPPDLLRYIVETNAQELTKLDERGNLPLHYAAKSKPHARDKRESFPAFHTKYVVDELLYKFPEGAGIPDSEGKFPLTLAVDTGKQWIGGGVKSMYDAYPEALQQIDMGSHPSLKKALSYNEEDPTSALQEGSSGVVKDELHDAIMLVQKPDVDVSEVVSAMWAHEEDAGVQMMGCIAISRMAAKANDMEVMRIALSAVPAVVNAMKAHPNEPAVQEKACNSLKKMATGDGKREVSFVASGAIAAIVGAMQAHVGDPVVQEEACGALADIVFVGGADRATIVASVSGFTAIVNALAAHPDAKMVQKEGCRALQAVTEYPHANLPELPRSQTEPLLQNAKEQFPAECTESAGILLSRLS